LLDPLALLALSWFDSLMTNIASIASLNVNQLFALEGQLKAHVRHSTDQVAKGVSIRALAEIDKRLFALNQRD
jgi:hypothetical protein